jgi:hypothetical protein
MHASDTRKAADVIGGEAIDSIQRRQIHLAEQAHLAEGYGKIPDATVTGQPAGGLLQMGRPGLGDLLDLPPLPEGELRRTAAPVLRVQRAEPVSVEVADHIPHLVLTGERHPRDRGRRHALRGQQHHLRPLPGHHRPAALRRRHHLRERSAAGQT